MNLKRRVTRFRSVVRSPSDAWLLARMLGWAATLPVAKRRVPRLELGPAYRDQALREIEAVIAAAPAPDTLVEDRRVQGEARATLERARDD